MTIKLTNTTLTATGVRGERIYYQGADRDCLTFIFDTSNTLDELDAAFTAEACEDITIVDDEHEYLHHGYTIRKSIEKTDEGILVRMAQRTHMEDELAALSQQLNDTMLAMCDIYEGLEV